MAPAPPLPVTEDTPPDMLAGSMDLRIVLPNGHSVKMSVERSTPMMDLLVQVTTLNKISTGGHVLQAIGEQGILPYKPSTPIGALDTWTIQVVPKLKSQTSTLQKKTPLKPLNQQQPFEQTFRLQSIIYRTLRPAAGTRRTMRLHGVPTQRTTVHLPRNQLFVMRVSPRTLLSDILHLTCTEKKLDPNKYELRHPANLSQLLSPSCTVADYGLQEVTVVARSRAPGMGSALSSSDIMALQREEDKRRQQARQQHGTGTGLGLVFNKRNRSSYCEGSVSSDSLGGRSISPARSDESASRSASPQAPSLPPMMAPVPPARPARKRRPAPKPPCSNNGPINNEQQTESNVQEESSSGTVVNGHSGGNNSKVTQVPVSHSRNSSDSSGYHEASVLSESPAEGNQISQNCATGTLPRQGKLTSGQRTQMKAHGASHGLSRSMSSLSGAGNMAGCQHSTSNSSLASSTGQGQKKKKAPPPPPGAGVTKDGQQEKHSSSLSLSSTSQDITESVNKTTSLERHLSGKSSAVASDQSPDKSSTLPGKMKMSQCDNRPMETTVQTSADTPGTETQPPEETCLDGDEKISEDDCASVPYVHEETSPVHSETHQDEHTNGTKSQSSNRDISKPRDKCFQQLPVPPVETTPEPPVELASRSKSPQTVDTSTPQVPAALEQEPALHAPVPKPRINSKPSALDDTVSLARRKPVPPPRLISSSSSSSIFESVNTNSSSVEEERCIDSANAEGGSGGRNRGKKQKVNNSSVGRTFGVGTTMLLLSQSRTDSTSSGSWEWHSVRSQISGDVSQDSDDDLNIAAKDMDMFDAITETSEVSGTVQPGNEKQNNTAAVNQLVDSYDDSESVSLVSSVFEYDSEHESSETSSTFKYPPPARLMKTKGENGFGASNAGSCHLAGKNGLKSQVVPEDSTDSSTSLQSMDKVSAFAENGNNIVEASASKQSWSLEYDSEADTEVNSGVDHVDQVEEAFRSVTVELEATIRPEEDLNALPPPPTSVSSVDDLSVDWEYQLPAPPSAFRDSDSPTFTEGGTVMLADSQVFREPSLSPEAQANIPQTISTSMELQDSLALNFNSQIHRNNVTRINPLFDPHHCGDDRKPTAFSDVSMETFKINTKHVYHQETQSQKPDVTEQGLLNSDCWRDQSKEMSTRTGLLGNHEQVNFAITTYQRPNDIDQLFNKDSENDRAHSVQHSSTGSTKRTTGALQHKYSSTSSLNSSTAGLSRTNSFDNSDITPKPHGPVSASSVKRSTSYISLVTNPLSHHGNDLQSGHTNILHTSRTTSVGNLTGEAQLDTHNKRTYETWGLRKTTSEDNVGQDLQEHLQDRTKSQSRVEEQKNTHIGREEQPSQQQIVITEEERARLLALQEQFLQLQEQLQNSGLTQQQQLSHPQVSAADAPLQSLQVLRSILPQLSQTKALHDNQAVNQQQKSDSLAFLRSENPPRKFTPKNKEDLSNHNSVKDATSVTSNQHNANKKTPNDKNTSEEKRYTYQGPPAINFTTWSERPKSQVTIKMDRDYRTGIGQAGSMGEHNETPTRTGHSKSKDKTLAVERNNDAETLLQSTNDDEVNAQNKVNNKANSSRQVTKLEPASLTMRLISHTTPSGFRKPVAVASQKVGSSSYIAEGAQKFSTSEAKEATGSSTVGLRVASTLQQSDPSRVPIVRAVELKKSFMQQQNMHSNSHSLHRSTTMLNGEDDRGHCGANMEDQRKTTSHHNGGSDEDFAVQTFAGVNFLAKRFSSVVSPSNGPPSFSTSQPLASYGEVDTVDAKGCDTTTSLPYNSTLSYKSVSSTNLNASNVNKYQGTQLKNGDGRGPGRYTSVIGINSDSDHSLSSSFHEPASESNRMPSRASGPSVVKVNGFIAPKQLMPVVKGFQFASAAANRDTAPPSPTKISNTSAHHPRVQRSESTSAIRSWRTVDATDQPSSTSFGNTNNYVQKNSNEPRPEPVIMNLTTNAESKPPLPPPPAIVLRKSTAHPRPKSLPAPQLNSRDQLMDAIRNFGGQEKLKHVRDNRDSSLNNVLIQ